MKKLFTLYLVLLHLFIIVVLVKSNFIEKVSYRLSDEATVASGEITDHHRWMSGYYRDMDESIPEGSVLFFGDSLTQALPVNAVTPNAVNFGIGSETTAGLLRRAHDHKSSISKARAIVIAMGINDLHWRNNQAIVDNYQKFLQLIPEQTPVYISSILPVDESGPEVHEENEQLREINKRLAKVAEQFANVCYLDTHTPMTNEEGGLVPEYHRGDGIHLSPAGQAVWIKQLRLGLNSPTCSQG